MRCVLCNRWPLPNERGWVSLLSRPEEGQALRSYCPDCVREVLRGVFEGDPNSSEDDRPESELEQDDCLLCRAAPATVEGCYCPTCACIAGAEAELAVDRFRQYLLRWAEFRDWEAASERSGAPAA
jgi:hypothetical protein